MSDTRVKVHPTLGILVCTDGHIMKPARHTRPYCCWTYGYELGQGYKGVTILDKRYKVHRLVAETFIPNPENKPEIDHINRNPSDNRMENLRWATRTENNRNTHANDGCASKYGVHQYEDLKDYNRKRAARWIRTDSGRASREKYLEKYWQTHRVVRCADGKDHKMTNERAEELLKLKVPERII